MKVCVEVEIEEYDKEIVDMLLKSFGIGSDDEIVRINKKAFEELVKNS